MSDKETLDLINLVKTKKAEIKTVESYTYKTNCSIAYVDLSGKSQTVNLHVATREKILDMLAYFLEKEVSYRKVTEVIRLHEANPIIVQSLHIDDTISDLKHKLTLLYIEKEKNKLAKLEERLGGLLDENTKKQLEIDKIKKELGL